MFTIRSNARISRVAGFSALLLLAACGSGSETGLQPPTATPATSPETGTGNPAPHTEPVPDSISLAAAYTDVSTAGGQPNWTEGSGTGQPIDGVRCVTSEAYHIHSIVSIYRDGTRMAVPAHIGLQGCTYELHTHDSTGIVHVETDAAKAFTLGQFFAVWGKNVTRSDIAGLPGTVRYYLVDKEVISPFNGTPGDIELLDQREILIVVGTAPAIIPRYRWSPAP